MKKSIFAREPTSVIESRNKAPAFFNADEVKSVKRHFDYLFNNSSYQEYRSRWLSIREYQLPHLGEFLMNPDQTNKGRRRDTKALDGEAWRANLTFAGGMASGLTPQSVQWFKFGFENENLNDHHGAKMVVDARLEMMNRILSGSNFYNASHTNYLELAFGQSPLGIFEDPMRGFHFETYPIGSYAYEVDAFGLPSCFAVQKKMTAVQIAQRFGMSNLPEKLQKQIKEHKGYSSEYDLCWLVEKNPKADARKMGRQYLPYLSMHWVKDGNKDEEFLRVGGYEEMPVSIARYQVIGSQAYGMGPGWYADGDTKMLFKMIQEALVNLELHARPPVQAPAELDVNYKPGQITRNKGSDGRVEALFSLTPIFQQIFEVSKEKREHIQRAYHTNLFAMLDQASMNSPGRTAYEFSLRNQEKMQQLGPVVERQNHEYLGPTIERCYNILERSGIFPAFPEEILEELEGEEVKVEYVSPLAQAQKMSGTQNVEMLLAVIAQVAQMNPDVVHLANWPEIIYTYTDKIGTEAKLLNSREEYAAKLEQIAQAAQQEKEEAMMLQGGGAAQSYTQAAANMQEMANDGSNPAMDQMLQSMGVGVG
jgi:Bacteriophage head to tail connecting protein.